MRYVCFSRNLPTLNNIHVKCIFDIGAVNEKWLYGELHSLN